MVFAPLEATDAKAVTQYGKKKATKVFFFYPCFFIYFSLVLQNYKNAKESDEPVKVFPAYSAQE